MYEILAWLIIHQEVEMMRIFFNLISGVINMLVMWPATRFFFSSGFQKGLKFEKSFYFILPGLLENPTPFIIHIVTFTCI